MFAAYKHISGYYTHKLVAVLVVALLTTVAAPADIAAMPRHTATSPSAATVTRDHTNTPLVIIRFNQRNVYFQRPLYTAISRALEVKPSARFTMVSVVPTHGGKRKYRVAEANFGKVIRYMREMGIPQHRLSVDRRSSNAVTSGEVHIYVR